MNGLPKFPNGNWFSEERYGRIFQLKQRNFKCNPNMHANFRNYFMYALDHLHDPFNGAG
jgi:hypothetical protein